MLATPSAASGGSYLACWQSTLGSLPFTFVRDIGSATGTYLFVLSLIREGLEDGDEDV